MKEEQSKHKYLYKYKVFSPLKFFKIYENAQCKNYDGFWSSFHVRHVIHTITIQWWRVKDLDSYFTFYLKW